MGEGPKPEPKSEPKREPKPAQAKRKPSHLRAASKMLRKEAAKILKRHHARLGPEISAQIEAECDEIRKELAAERWAELEESCERLDELLHQHASFARKSPLRETIENVGIAVLVALGLRSCVYEPFKIPSPSMVPTLLPGDHIFVNKFRYGIQIPFTTTILGEDMIADIERGEVVVFRYPLDPELDYIKRVIGLPGDVVRVDGDAVALKRPGDADFVYLEREKLDEPCPTNDGLGGVAENCVLYKETLGDRSYTIRIDGNHPPAGAGRVRQITVPEGSLLVMGDNRRVSADSIAWRISAEAVIADGVIGEKDLRDLTDQKIFNRSRVDGYLADPNRDVVHWIAERGSPRHDLALELWRDPVLGADAVYAALAIKREGITLEDLMARGDGMLGPGAKKQVLARSNEVSALAVSEDETGWGAALRLDEYGVVAKFTCGKAVCESPGEFARQLAMVVEALEVDAQRPARELLRRPSGFRFVPQWSGRDGVDGRYVERRFHLGSEPAPNGHGPREVRLRAWRAPREGAEFLRSAAAHAAGLDAGAEPQTLGDGANAIVGASEHGRVVVARAAGDEVVFVLECGSARCSNDAQALELAGRIADAAPAAAKSAESLVSLLTRETLGDKWAETPPIYPELYEWDRVVLTARVQDTAYATTVDVTRVDPSELPELEAQRRAVHASAQDDPRTGGYRADQGAAGEVFGFSEPSTGAFVELSCTRQLCSSPGVYEALVDRAREKVQDTGNFVDPQHQLDQPFVPRGNVKGRAERIWWPVPRFWTPIE